MHKCVLETKTNKKLSYYKETAVSYAFRYSPVTSISTILSFQEPGQGQGLDLQGQGLKIGP